MLPVWTFLQQQALKKYLQVQLTLANVGKQLRKQLPKCGEYSSKRPTEGSIGRRGPTTVLAASVALWGLLPVPLAGLQGRPGGEFGGGDYWGDVFGGETLASMCGGLELFQILSVSAALIAMFFWAFQAARGSSQKWKLAGLAFLVMAFIGDPIAWMELLGLDVVIESWGGRWDCLTLGNGMF